MLQINRCPQCGKLSDHYEMIDQPTDWITVAVINERLETICSWECVIGYAQAQKDNEANAAPSA